MNLDHKEQRLKKLLEDNIREGKVGTAIAITGSWGVGKTYFGISSEKIINLKINIFMFLCLVWSHWAT